ncbi:mercury(II) reductase [Candidatus Berkelbacteria bacterium]|nr:mercury(II) reductase [Candidatus Berkelbacteria bacterium]
MEKFDFDLIIIGGGAGAFAAAIRANELKAKTAMVNHGLPLGGTCVNVGCVPSKTLLWAGEVIHLAEHHGIPGIEFERKKFDFATVVKDELALVERLRAEKYEKVLKNLKHVTLIEGKATFISANEVEVGGKRLRADQFIIAAGSTANIPPIEDIQKVGYLTHIEALKINKQPKSLIVLGAGPLGLEFAQMYSRFGTKVTVLQKGHSIFGKSESELENRLVEVLKQEGITVITNVEVKSAHKQQGQKVLIYKKVAGKQAEVAAEEILLAAGKTANTAGLGLDKAGVKTDQRKAVAVSETFQTSVPHIFAVGDVTNLPLRLEITAGREGTLAAENALSGTKRSIDYNTVPYTIFTDPQLAGVGPTDAQAVEQGFNCTCRTVSFQEVPRALIMRRTEGLIKMVADNKTKRILGVHILSPQAGELIAEAMMLVKNKNTIDDVENSLPMFPTLSEAIKLAALSFTRDISKLSCCI